ncbi:MAG TPA: ATP-binding protein, partial [Thermoanaerobaculaceae bacterium]|nr:ATP-binding protein [Thermoanaerobaculaceae bacterium]
MGTPPLRILFVEDVPAEAELAAAELRRAGLSFESLRVETRAQLLAALGEYRPALVLSDYTLPGFNGMEALALTLERAPETPFILVTGSTNEETAVACMKAGAWDYILKDRLSRLPLAVRAALDRAHVRAREKQAQEALRESEERYRLVLANSLDAQFLTSPDGTIHAANPAACAMFGRSEAEICRLGRAGMIDTTDPRFAAGLAERAQAGRFRGELTGLRADGTKFPVEVSSSVFRDAGGALHTSLAIRDLTQREALEAQLRQAQKMEAIGSLAGAVAHDFNNILQAMLSHIQLLRSPVSEPARVAAAAAELEQQVKRGAALTRQLLLFSRQETTKPEPLDLNEAVSTSLQLLRRLVRENISFRLDVAEAALAIRADRGQLDQVLMNLVVNAADAMPDGGILRVGTGRSDDGSPWVSVSDTGCGIPEAIRDRVFEPFFTTKAPGKGTGIGLSVVRGIVEQHGGAIVLESGVGRGTTVRITLPAADTAAVPADGPASGDKPLPRGRGERVLIVEDEQGAREGLAEILTSL